MNSPQFVTDSEGRRIGVLLDLETYEQMLEDLEDLEDIRAADAAKREDPKGLPLDEAFAEIEQMCGLGDHLQSSQTMRPFCI